MTQAARPIVSLSVFEGPLDLLLQLIEQQRLDITAIALAQVADQYLGLVRAAEDPDADTLAEFLVIGARLLLIKTRALLPRPPVVEGAVGEEDVGDHLARQLREYSQFKQAAAALRGRESAGLRTHTRVGSPPAPPPPSRPPPIEARVEDLVAAVQRRLALLASAEQPATAVPRPRTLTIAEVSERLRERLAAQTWVTFDDLLSLAVTRTEVIVTLWTVLELLKRHIITVEQSALFEQITLGRGEAFEELHASRVSGETEHS